MEPEMRYHHGNSPAAWTAVGLGLAGCVVSALAFPFDSTVLFVIGLVIVVLGLIAGRIMSMAGLGNMPSYTVEEPAETNPEGPTS